MNSMIRLATISNRVSMANPLQSVQHMLSLIDKVKLSAPDVILFPMNALSGGQCGHLFSYSTMQKECDSAFHQLLEATADIPSYIILGTTILKNAKPQNAVIILYQGEILEQVTEELSIPLFCVNDAVFCIYNNSLQAMPTMLTSIAQSGCDVVLFPSHTTTTANSTKKDIDLITTISDWAGCSVAVANGGNGDTSYPYIAKGYAAITECGQCLESNSSLNESCIVIQDIDLDIIRAKKAKLSLPVFNDVIPYQTKANIKETLLRTIHTEPYLPIEQQEREDFLADLFQLQSASLARRMENIHCKRLVIGVSGGLDSTLALLVCVRACDMLNLPHENIIAITMQGFGTSGRTHQNALALMKGLGCSLKEIPIKESVLQHFHDIEHNENNKNIVYENAQARERTQILLDIANMENGIVVGTGDLSEAALGFCTFGGDQFASYNVNVCVTKTMIRYLVNYLAQQVFIHVKDILIDILNTPVSPELLPLDKSGDIQQKTEEILGEYELHDFFLYYFICHRFSPKKILAYANIAFGRHTSSDGFWHFRPDYIKDKLKLFLKRIMTSQFKRSCCVDSAIITELNLSAESFFIPSDVSNTDFFSSQL